MKRLIVTMACHDKVQEYGKITFPLIQAYAYKCKADFLVHQQLSGNWKHIGYEKWEYAKHLRYYDRIMHIDADMIVRSTTPNLFDMVPEDKFAAVDEHQWETPGLEAPYLNRYTDLATAYLGVPRFYINVGMYLFSKCHKYLFNPRAREKWDGFYEQTHLNALLHLYNKPLYLLDWKWNYMSLMENHGLRKEEAHIVHYAGGWRGYDVSTICKMMKADIR